MASAVYSKQPPLCWQRLPAGRSLRFLRSRQAARPSCGAAACIAHDGEPGGSEREHDAVATVLIIGASRGIGLETARAALAAGHSARALARSARTLPADHPNLARTAPPPPPPPPAPPAPPR